MYKDIVDPSFTWNNFDMEEQRRILACDRSNNYLDTSAISYLYPHVNNIKISVEKCLHDYKKSL